MNKYVKRSLQASGLIIGVVVAILLGSVLVGAAKGLAYRYSPSGEANHAAYELQVSGLASYQ